LILHKKSKSNPTPHDDNDDDDDDDDDDYVTIKCPQCPSVGHGHKMYPWMHEHKRFNCSFPLFLWTVRCISVMQLMIWKVRI